VPGVRMSVNPAGTGSSEASASISNSYQVILEVSWSLE